jgi:hypothetical protein
MSCNNPRGEARCMVDIPHIAVRFQGWAKKDDCSVGLLQCLASMCLSIVFLGFHIFLCMHVNTERDSAEIVLSIARLHLPLLLLKHLSCWHMHASYAVASFACVPFLTAPDVQ